MSDLLDSDLDTGLLRQFITAASHVTIATREARAALGHRATRLARRHTLVAVARLLVIASVIGAEGAVATDGSRVGFAIPRHHATQSTGAAGKTGRATNVHVSKSVDEHVFISTGADGSGGASRSDGGGATVLASVFSEAGNVVAKGGREAGSGGNRGRSVRAQVSERLGSAEVGACSKSAGSILEAAQVARLLVTNTSRVVESILIANISKVGGCGAVEASSLSLTLLNGLNLGHGRAEPLTRGFFVDVDSALVGLSLGDMGEAHVVRDGVDNASLRRA